MKTVAVAPSSGLPGHLLPAGEKREVAACPSNTSHARIEVNSGKREFAIGIPFSPTGRRWPEGSDEGAASAPKSTTRDITKRQSGKTVQARKLRQSETEEEHHLWSDLRARRLNGHKFSRQIPLGPFIVDFLCREKRLIVEVDGFHHADSRSDRSRTAWLNARGYSILRFWNHEISRQRRSVLETILAALNGEIAVEDEKTGFYSPASAELKE
ncbi:endonuclease domain-containing protein [Rhizobium sp. Root482]|uniref:endonuclease domain-containing protein n=1 Tax=Rhizobium sp. Root482 TaxID=1736543 RepID=UPI0006F7AC60|nr:DUF559 domain-containing protein [Rhizobium sp. Root482]KQY15234.1 hypothetical protein ASD31_07545 [Rhizobium sp. Root482]